MGVLGGLILKPSGEAPRDFISVFTNPTSHIAYFQANNDVYDNTSVPNFELELYLIVNVSIVSGGIFSHGIVFGGTNAVSYQLFLSTTNLRFAATDISNNQLFFLSAPLIVGVENKINAIANNGVCQLLVNDNIVDSDTYTGEIDFTRGTLFRNINIGGRHFNTLAPDASIDAIKITDLDTSQLVLDIPKVFTGKDEVTGVIDEIVDITEGIRP